MATTLKLSPSWDLTLDGNGDLATVTGKNQIAQDVASSVRVWKGEDCWDTSRGVPYKTNIFGQRPSREILNAYMEREARRIEGVAATQLFMKTENREANIELIVTTDDGETVNVL